MPPMAGTPAQTTSSTAVTPRCIVLCADPQPPAELVGGLDKRGMRVVTARHAPGVMLALARHDAATVVVVEPQREAKLDPLLKAIRRYYPLVGVWTYSAGHDAAVGPRLTKLEPAATPAPALVPPTPAEAPASAEPANPAEPQASTATPPPPAPRNGSDRSRGRTAGRRLVEAAAAMPAAPSGHLHDEADDRDAPLVSQEELTMLLAESDAPQGEERER